MSIDPRLIEATQYISQAPREELQLLSKAMTLRFDQIRQQESLENMATIYVGDKVITRNLRTAKLNGQTGEVTAIGDKTFHVQLLWPVDTGHKVWSKVNVPFQCVEKV